MSLPSSTTTSPLPLDFEKIYALILDPACATDHSLVLQYLSDQGVSGFEDLELLEEPGLDQILGYLKPIPKKKLMRMLNRPL